MIEYEERFSELLSSFDEEMRAKVHQQGLRVQRAAKMLAPVNRSGPGGELRDSIHINTTTYGDRIESEIYTDTEYAVYVEFGTGPVGNKHHSGTDPDSNPIYSTEGWMIPVDDIDQSTAEFYGFRPIYDNGELIGYYTLGQAARPYMYPALNDLKESISEELGDDLRKMFLKVTKK